MDIFFKFFTILVLCFVPFSLLSEEEKFKDLEIQVGESLEIPFKEEDSLQISRKGIVDVQILEKKIRVVGLKSGIVVLSMKNYNEKFSYFKYYFRVSKKESSPEDNFLEKLVYQAGLKFEESTYTVSGETDQFYSFYRLSKLCKKRQRCLSHISLNKKGQRKIHDHVQKILGPSYDLEVKKNGKILIFAPCSEKESLLKGHREFISHLLEGEEFDKEFDIVCRTMKDSRLYILQSKMIVMESNIAKDLGLESPNLVVSDMLSKVNLKLHSALQDKKAELVGAPVIKIQSGSEAYLESGSEYLYHGDSAYKDKELYTEWKSIGLSLNVKLLAQSEDKVHLNYDFRISNPSSRDNRRILTNRISGSILLEEKKSKLVGSIKFTTEGSHEQSNPLIESVPIIAPLFKQSSSNRAESSIFLEFYLESET